MVRHTLHQTHGIGGKVAIVQEAILSRIHDHNMKAGDRIPSEAELIKELGVSKNTVREAIGLLVHRGILKRRQGSGTYITEASEPDTLRVGVVAGTGLPSSGANSYIAGVIAGIAERAGRGAPILETTLLSADRNPQGDDGLFCLDAVRAKRVDALVITITEPLDEECLAVIEEQGCPVVFLGISRMNTQRPWIKPDFFNGAYRATRHFIETGRERIGLLLSSEGSLGSIEFQAGYCAALIETKRPVAQDLIAFTGRQVYTVPDVAAPLLDGGADAVLCHDDETAAQLMQVARWAKEAWRMSTGCGPGYTRQMAGSVDG